MIVEVRSYRIKPRKRDEFIRLFETRAVPAPVVYSLSDYGRSVLPLVEDVRKWGHTHLSR